MNISIVCFVVALLDLMCTLKDQFGPELKLAKFSSGDVFKLCWGIFMIPLITDIHGTADNYFQYCWPFKRGRGRKVINCKHIWINLDQDVEQPQVFLGRGWKKEKRTEDEGWTSQSSRVELPTAIFLSQRGSGGLFLSTNTIIPDLWKSSSSYRRVAGSLWDLHHIFLLFFRI